MASGNKRRRQQWKHDVASPSVTLCVQTILVGDSGVGKTSLLVQFDQGKFIPGSFTATVGIGFTVSPHFLSTTTLSLTCFHSLLPPLLTSE